MSVKTGVDNDRCPHCKTFTTSELNQIFYSAEDGTYCLQCGGWVEFSRTGRAIKYRKPRKVTA